MFSWSLLAANIFVELAQELLAGLINSVGKTSRNNLISFFFFLAWDQKNFSVCISLRLQGQEVRA